MTGILWIEIDRIEEPLHLLRSADTESQDFKDLVSSIRADGFWESKPLDCSEEKTPSGDTLYVLNDGMQRLSAARMLGLPKVPIAVYQKPLSEGARLERSVVANATSVKMKPVQYGLALAKLVELNPGLTIVDLSRRVRKDQKWVAQMLKLAKLEGPAVELVDSGSIPLANAQGLVEVQKAGILVTKDLIEKAQSESIEAFAETASAVIDQWKGSKKKKEPVAKLRPLPDVRAELERAENDSQMPKGYLDALRWTLRKDAITAASEGIEQVSEPISKMTPVRQEVARELIHWALGAGADPSELSTDAESEIRKLVESCEAEIVSAIQRIGVIQASEKTGSSLDSVRRWAKRERCPSYAARRKIFEAGGSHA